MSDVVIGKNMRALTAHRNIKSISDKNAIVSERLSNGLRINRSADDAAGLAISEKLKAQIRGMKQAQQNTEDAINVCKTMDGGMECIQEIMIRQRELIIQALNDTNTDEDRTKIQLEIDQLTSEIESIANRVEFNKINLLNRGNTGQLIPVYDVVTTSQFEPVYRKEYRYTLDVISNQISNDVFSTAAVDNNGYFNFFAINATGQTSQMLYGDVMPTDNGRPSTSHPGILINIGSETREYRLWGGSSQITNLGTTYSSASSEWETSYRIQDLAIGLDCEVVQRVSIAKYGADRTETVTLTAPDGTDLSGTYTYWDGGQSYCVEYEVINNGTSDFTFDFMYHVDTQINGNDSAPFLSPGNSSPLKSTTWEGTQIPNSLLMYDSVNQPLVNVEITFRNTGNYSIDSDSEPDRVSIGQYSSVSNFGFRGNGGSVGDSGYAVIWSDRDAVAGSSSIKMKTYFGVASPPPDVIGSIGQVVEFEALDHYKEIITTHKNITGWTKNEIEEQLWIQCGANSGQGMLIDLYDCRPGSLYRDVFEAITTTINVDGTPKIVTLTKLVTKPQEEATASLMALDKAFDKISSYRSNVGAQQNRLGFTDNYLATAFINLENANSRIADADMAKEMMNLAKTNVLQHAGMAMLAQANQNNSIVQLLK